MSKLHFLMTSSARPYFIITVYEKYPHELETGVGLHQILSLIKHSAIIENMWREGTHRPKYGSFMVPLCGFFRFANFKVGKINFKVGKINFKVGKININVNKINFKVAKINFLMSEKSTLKLVKSTLKLVKSTF